MEIKLILRNVSSRVIANSQGQQLEKAVRKPNIKQAKITSYM